MSIGSPETLGHRPKGLFQQRKTDHVGNQVEHRVEADPSFGVMVDGVIAETEEDHNYAAFLVSDILNEASAQKKKK